MQEWIESSETDPITVPRQLLGHFESEDGPFHGMMQNVQADQAGVKIAVFKATIGIVFRYRHSIAISSITTAASGVKSVQYAWTRYV